MTEDQQSAVARLCRQLTAWEEKDKCSYTSVLDAAYAVRKAFREAAPSPSPEPSEHASFSKTTSAAFERRVLQRIEADPRSVLAGDLLEMLVSQGAESEEKVRFYDAAELPGIAALCREAAEICYGKPPLIKFTYDGNDFSAQVKAAGLALMTREESARAYPKVTHGGVDPGDASGDRTISAGFIGAMTTAEKGGE